MLCLEWMPAAGRTRRSAGCLWGLLFVPVLAAATGLLGPGLYRALDHFMLTGRFFPINIIERLNSPIRVIGWTSEGLQLEDGRTIALPELVSLPASSAALSEATSRGVEIAADGRVYGLVRIDHWCGNDPVGEHIARIDLSLLLLFLGEGVPAGSVALSPPQPPGGAWGFSQWGWNESQHWSFEKWCRARAASAGVPGR